MAVVEGNLELSGTRMLWWKAKYSGDFCDPVACHPSYDPPAPMLYSAANGLSAAVTGPVAAQAGRALGELPRLCGQRERDLAKGPVQQRPYSGESSRRASGERTSRSMTTTFPGRPVWPARRTTAPCIDRCLPQHGDEDRGCPDHHPEHAADRDVRRSRRVRRIRRPLPLDRDAEGSTSRHHRNRRRRPDPEHAGSPSTTRRWRGSARTVSPRSAPNSAFVAPPRFLGNAVGPTSFQSGGRELGAGVLDQQGAHHLQSHDQVRDYGSPGAHLSDDHRLGTSWLERSGFGWASGRQGHLYLDSRWQRLRRDAPLVDQRHSPDQRHHQGHLSSCRAGGATPGCPHD